MRAVSCSGSAESAWASPFSLGKAEQAGLLAPASLPSTALQLPAGCVMSVVATWLEVTQMLDSEEFSKLVSQHQSHKTLGRFCDLVMPREGQAAGGHSRGQLWALESTVHPLAGGGNGGFSLWPPICLPDPQREDQSAF